MSGVPQKKVAPPTDTSSAEASHGEDAGTSEEEGTSENGGDDKKSWEVTRCKGQVGDQCGV